MTAIKSAPSRPQIRTENPETAPVAIPGYRCNVRLSTANKTNSVYQTMGLRRVIEQLSGDLLIVNERGQSTEASHLILPTPPTRGGFEQGVDGNVLRIVSACPLRHIIETEPGVINGTASKITFGGIGSISIFAQGGKWVVLGSSNVEVQ
jgi:hypothetical protein